MPSNTVLISGPAMGAAQILIRSCSSVFLPPMSTAVRISVLSLWELSMSFYTFHRHSLPSWSCEFNLQIVQPVGRFGVFFVSHTASGFQLWFISTSACGLSTGVLLMRLPWRTWVCPCKSQGWTWCISLGCRGSGGTRYSGELMARIAGNTVF